MKLIRPFPVILFVLFSLFPRQANAQVLISLLLGDKLNTEKLEFGLVTGINRSYLSGIESAKGLNNFNLGFYFHIKMLESSYLSTGVLVKSNVGAQNMSVYSTGDDNIDEIFNNGELTKRISYFYVPVLWQQRLKARWLLEGGFQMGLRNKAKDIFEIDDGKGEATYEMDVGDLYTRFDAGIIGGIGYKLKTTPKSMSIGVNYYQGFTDIVKSGSNTVRNSSLYFYFKVPVGTGKEASVD
ncbi:outer membrane beta-barrel protein [Mangrovivirga sp. M17]|uniref:Outer membrane beta-barrel protein n=1 Tax=Mangrovivirga halotolerans TaxID=2993936 RepID=A0ABT3RMZ8_9BACT|nr:outer membrane beta-barrel protein [Mangrovivirga halotolerans]MCX2742966.1 outer membrane beta-barrel protein [Mangrovivirga halotolerans]